MKKVKKEKHKVGRKVGLSGMTKEELTAAGMEITKKFLASDVGEQLFDIIEKITVDFGGFEIIIKQKPLIYLPSPTQDELNRIFEPRDRRWKRKHPSKKHGSKKDEN